MRTDVHAPKSLKPEDYEFVACGNFATAEIDPYSPLATSHRYLIDEGWRFADTSSGTGQGCQHCGAFLIYYAILKHLPTHTLLRVGETCLDNRFSLANSEFQKLRKQAKLNRERKRLSNKREEFLSDPENHEAYDWAKSQPQAEDEGWDESFEGKYVRFVDQFGDASDRFGAAILRAKARKAEWEAKKAEEAAKAQPVVEGKGLITGTIKSVKWQDNAYGGGLKMLVLDDRQFKVWGSVPSSIVRELDDRLHSPELGKNSYKDLLPLRVSFTATVKGSMNDIAFGFFSRPTNANIID